MAKKPKAQGAASPPDADVAALAEQDAVVTEQDGEEEHEDEVEHVHCQPAFEPPPPAPRKTEIMPEADFAVSLRGVLVQFHERKKALVEPDLLAVIESAGVPFSVVSG